MHGEDFEWSFDRVSNWRSHKLDVDCMSLEDRPQSRSRSRSDRVG